MTPRLKISERDIARAIGDLLQYDGWRLLWCEPMSRRDWGKGFGEPGMADLLCIRYGAEGTSHARHECSELMWIEMKKPGGMVSAKQRAWHVVERARGALTLVLGEDCEASVDGWMAWYRGSGLNRGRV